MFSVSKIIDMCCLQWKGQIIKFINVMIHTIHLLFTLQEFKLLSYRKKNHNYFFFPETWAHLSLELRLIPFLLSPIDIGITAIKWPNTKSTSGFIQTFQSQIPSWQQLSKNALYGPIWDKDTKLNKILII